MTDEIKAKYEEAAKEYVKWHNLKAPMETDGEATFRIFLAGAAHAHNEAIDAAIKLFKTRGSFGTPFIDELEKFKKL